MTRISAGLFDGERLRPGTWIVTVEGPHITSVEPDGSGPSDTLLAPGFIDLQVNGGGGTLLNDAISVAAMGSIAASHAACGTTALLPTLISGTAPELAAALAAADRAVTEGVPGVLGVHLEGPFLATSRAGVHPPRNLRPMTDADQALLSAPIAGIRLVTVAPDVVPVARIEALRRDGVVVFAGHADVSAEQLALALRHGVTGVTHLFNAMSQFGSRAPGMVGGAMADADCMAGLICDGLHVHPQAVRAAWRAMGPQRLFLVSDAMPTAASDATQFEWLGEVIRLVDGRLAQADGTLAGAHLTMAEAVRRAVTLCDLPVEDALRMATGTPARAIGRTDIGRIEVGARADLLLLDGALRTVAIWQGGRPVPVRASAGA